MKYRLLWSLAFVGVALHFAGLAWDVYLHAQDSTLAAGEGLFTLTNPGHLLIVAGMSLTAASVLAIGLAWLGDHGFAQGSASARGVRLASLPVIGLAAAGFLWVANAAEDGGSHPHDDAAMAAHSHEGPDRLERLVLALSPATAVASDGHSHTQPATASASTDSAMGEGNAQVHGTELAVTAAQLNEASDFYAKVQVSAERYKDVRSALSGGYIQITQDLPGIAAHFVNLSYNADGDLMNPDAPEILLYTKRMDGNWNLVGFMFSSEKVTETPPSFFGALDVWHRHENLCFIPNAVMVTDSAAKCPGVFLKTTAWNLHVWTAPGASGLFAHDFAPISPGAFPAATRPAAQEVLVRAQ